MKVYAMFSPKNFPGEEERGMSFEESEKEEEEAMGEKKYLLPFDCGVDEMQNENEIALKTSGKVKMKQAEVDSFERVGDF